MYIPSTELVVFSAHVLMDEKIPNRESEYFREIDDIARSTSAM